MTKPYIVDRRGMPDPTPFEDNSPPEILGTCPLCGELICRTDRVQHLDILKGRMVHDDCADRKFTLNQIFAMLDLEDLQLSGNAGWMFEEGYIKI